MLDNIRKHIPLLEILIGFSLYFYFVVEASLSLAILWIILFIYLWLFTTIYLNYYNFRSFLHLLCLSGIIVSLTLFFTTGVEETPFPKGALIFHADGIAKA